MTDVDSASPTEAREQDCLEALEVLAERIPGALRDRDADQTLRGADEASAAAESGIALLEHLAGYPTLIRKDIGVAELSQIKSDLRDLAHAGGVIAAATKDTLGDVIEELYRLSDRVPLVERPMVQAWQRRVEATFDTGGSLGNILQRIPETREIGKEFNNLYQAATALKLRRDTAELLAVKFNELECRLKALRSDLSRVGVGREVFEFLVAVSERRATLTLLTRDVRDWLADRDALELFHVTL